TRVDIVLCRTCSSVSNDVRSLALRSNEQNATATGHRVRNQLQSLVQKRNGLRQVDDVNVVARAKDVRRHLRVPAVGLVAEVNASFEKLAHAEFSQFHYVSSFFRLASADH